ncbi:MAG: hypothetical protein QGD93_10295 [Actinomycetota bacterium]|nr:hypothetical protein [Actinomycetota bacterium]
MATVTEDTIVGARARVTRNGWERERGFIVTDVDVSTGDLLKNAVDDPGVPDIGDEYPTDDSLILVEIIPSTDSTTTAKLRLLYRVPTPGDVNPSDPDAVQIEVGTSTTSVETDRDVEGTILEVEYVGSPKDQQKQKGTVTVDAPVTSLIIRRRESNSPEELAKAYVPSLNANMFRGDIPGSWKCTAINGTSDDNGENFDVTYVFAYRADELTAKDSDDIDGKETLIGWWKRFGWTNDKGKFPDDLVEGLGKKWIRVYPLKDWSELNIA